MNSILARVRSLKADELKNIDPARVSLPKFDRECLPIRILHIGPGAFNRAHQMDYFDRLNEIEPDWGVAAVALRSRKAPYALSAQDGLYTLVTLGKTTSYRIIGSLKQIDFGDSDEAKDHFSRDSLRLITLTITEKGYCLDPSGSLDFAHPDIQDDIGNPEQPSSAIGWLTAGLKRRKASGLGGLTVLSCDNLPANGEKLRGAVLALADRLDPTLEAWISANICFPSSMVDSITPATDEALIDRVGNRGGYVDTWPIQREEFTSWVIEKPDRAEFPALDKVGAIFSENVALHEQAKLRLLNGAHSTLAYLGLAYGNSSVAEAMTNEDLRTKIAKMMTDEIAPSLTPPDGVDLKAYTQALLERFANPAIDHKLSQIAWDGSQKLPIRLLATIRDNIALNRSFEGLATGVAAWMRFVIRITTDQAKLTDPLGKKLQRIASTCRNIPADDVAAFLTLSDIFGQDLPASEDFRNTVISAYADVLTIEKTKKSGRCETVK